MAEKLQAAFIGDIVVSDSPEDVLIAYGLGSCVAVCLYDPVAKVGGMLHSLLPTAPNGSVNGSNPGKFVDQGVPLLVDSLLTLGGKRTRLIATLVGGAQLLSAQGSKAVPIFNGRLKVGMANVLTAEVALQALGMRIQARATGGHIGRTVRLYLTDGRVTVKTLEHEERVLE